MILLCWNCHGLGNRRAIRSLAELVRTKDPKVLFLSETKLGRVAAERLCVRLGYANCLVVDRVGLGGGLMLLWSSEISVQILSYSQGHIDNKIFDVVYKYWWRFTGFYGNPDANNRRHSWDLMVRLHSLYNLPWLCGGDFNEIVGLHEKMGGLERSESQMRAFKYTIDSCGLKDLGFRGYTFTWNNNQLDHHTIQGRLDWFLAFYEWLAMYNDFSVSHLGGWDSDHTLLELTIRGALDSPRRRKVFRFEEMWLRHE